MPAAALLPNHVLVKMSPDDRKLLGKAGRTAAECIERAEARTERAAQKLFASWLSLRSIYFIQARADKRSTIRAGHCDFSIFHAGKVLFIEMKGPGGRLSPDQETCIAELIEKGFSVVVAHSAVEAIASTKQFIGVLQDGLSSIL
jgi:VRR-NUC domain